MPKHRQTKLQDYYSRLNRPARNGKAVAAFQDADTALDATPSSPYTPVGDLYTDTPSLGSWSPPTWGSSPLHSVWSPINIPCTPPKKVVLKPRTPTYASLRRRSLLRRNTVKRQRSKFARKKQKEVTFKLSRGFKKGNNSSSTPPSSPEFKLSRGFDGKTRFISLVLNVAPSPVLAKPSVRRPTSSTSIQQGFNRTSGSSSYPTSILRGFQRTARRNAAAAAAGGRYNSMYPREYVPATHRGASSRYRF